MNHSIIYDYYSPELCKKLEDSLIIFGDNMLRKGTGGQACIRKCKNSLGVATKILPTMSEEAFFHSEEIARNVVMADIDNAVIISESLGKPLLFPASGLGTGLAKLNEMYPKVFEEMNEDISELIGKDYGSIVRDNNV